ncbi:sensor domain-containing diguanylate cyclase [Paraburkholderia kururiensis]|uniref:diguanylate cyclase n=1 Tax=Paraburkholderia kururiensis TaxID=984307 RepID=A0ABZ0WGF9_9BURK|nr:sensor domain-containing diguanylate cyclase [Paraburkholderia kururiensis]WQD76413.1 sensor domain-containing diguanylate cyclase [Paraburkholderia kururiensis]
MLKRLIRLLRHPASVVWVSLALAMAISAVAVWAAVEMQHDAMRRANETAQNVSLLIERDTARNLELYDLSLKAVIGGLHEPGVMKLAPQMRQRVLFDSSAMAQDLGSLFVIDVHGNVVADSRAVPPRRVNVSDRDYFKVHRDSPNVGLYVSRPFKPRLTAGDTSIALSRRLSNPDGSFAGIVVGTMRLAYFRRLFEGTNLGERGSITLMLTDGTVLMRRPLRAWMVGVNLAGSDNFNAFQGAPEGRFFAQSAIDGVDRWYVYRHIHGFPMILSVGQAIDDIDAEWRRRAWIIGVLTVLLDVAIVALAVLFSQQLRRRIAMEDRLRVLARTDGLTGINNRRAFDERANTEWRRARRSGRPLSALICDIDHFKTYNDRYGHAAGDDALTAVAGCIASYARRPGDSAARYGGEEFTVLLAETAERDAMRLAQQIRAAVEALKLRHAGNPRGVLTVSIGVAGTDEHTFGTLSELLEAADAALYRAKADGRNCVRQARALEAVSSMVPPTASETTPQLTTESAKETEGAASKVQQDPHTESLS